MLEGWHGEIRGRLVVGGRCCTWRAETRKGYFGLGVHGGFRPPH